MISAWWNKWFGKTDDIKAPGFTGATLRINQKEADEALLTKGICPDCESGVTMRLGPQGGSADNCMCIACRHEWNLLLFNGVTILDDMGRATEARARTIYGWTEDTGTPTRIDINPKEK